MYVQWLPTLCLMRAHADALLQLYSTFAAPFQFYDILLQILYVSDYRDPALTLEIWDGLMDKSQSKCCLHQIPT